MEGDKHPSGGEETGAPGGVGPRWGWVSLDRPTRLGVAWAVAPSEEEAARTAERRAAGPVGLPDAQDSRLR